ncbi:MAG: O-antigen ligase family protein [Dermatophilaceae bacterium]
MTLFSAAMYFLARHPSWARLGLVGIVMLLAFSIVALSRRDAVAALSVMVAFLFLIPETYVIAGPLKSLGNPAQMVGLFSLGMWGAGRVLGRIPARPNHPMRWMLFAWALSALASFTAGMTRVLVSEESEGSTRFLFLFASALGIALLAIDGLGSRKMVETVLSRLVLMAGISAAIGIAESVVGLDYRSTMHLPGLAANGEDVVDLRAGFARVQGGAAHPIEYAVVLGAMAPLALHFALTGPTRARRRVAWLCFGAILMVTPMTVSRSGLLSIAVGLAVYVVHLSGRARFSAAILGLIGLGVFSAVMPGLMSTLRYFVLAGSDDSSISGRTDDYGKIPEMIGGHEFFGRGLGTWSSTRYFFLDNQYLLTYLEGGLFALVILIGVFVTGMSSARGYRKRCVDPTERSLGQALTAAIAALAINALAFDEFSFRQTFFVLALLLGCSGALWGLAKAREDAGTSAFSPPEKLSLQEGSERRAGRVEPTPVGVP